MSCPFQAMCQDCFPTCHDNHGLLGFMSILGDGIWQIPSGAEISLFFGT